jgi:hypothetical protein
MKRCWRWVWWNQEVGDGAEEETTDMEVVLTSPSQRPTRKQKRAARHEHGLMRVKDQPRRKRGLPEDMGLDRLKALQETDVTLAKVRTKATEGQKSTSNMTV